MSSCCGPSTSDNSASSCGTSESGGCGTGQVAATIACPKCRRLGVTLSNVTPVNTLKRGARVAFDKDIAHYFCETPSCDVAYYNGDNDQTFALSELKNLVTVKDESPETPLCYCFKVLKQQALEEIAKTGTTNVFDTIQSKMKPGQSCFCEKANPRGDTCSKDIQAWLLAQGVEPSSASVGGCGDSGCDTPASEEKNPEAKSSCCSSSCC